MYVQHRHLLHFTHDLQKYVGSCNSTSGVSDFFTAIWNKGPIVGCAALLQGMCLLSSAIVLGYKLNGAGALTAAS